MSRSKPMNGWPSSAFSEHFARRAMGWLGHHQFVVAQRDDLELGPAGGQRDDAEVDLAIETGGVDLVRPAVLQVHLHVGVPGQAALDGRRQGVQADAVDGRDPHRSRDRVRAGPQAELDGGEAVEHRLHLVVQQAAGLGRASPDAGGALDEAAAVALLQCA
jgi:hypothetical protein